MNRRLSSLALLLALGAPAYAQGDGPKKAAPKVPAELAKARARAAVHNKRVLVVLPGGDLDLATMLKRERSISRKLLYEFETVQLGAEQMADHVRPALLVQDAAGKTMAKIAGDVFLHEGKIAGKALLAAVEPHFCAPVDAQQKLDDARKLARKTGKNILIRFDAPW